MNALSPERRLALQRSLCETPSSSSLARSSDIGGGTTLTTYVSVPRVPAVGGSWIAGKRQIAGKQWSVCSQQAPEVPARGREVAQ